MWELDYKESWAPRNWFFLAVVLETLESPLDNKEIQPVHPTGNQSWIFIGRTDAEAETPIVWPPDAKKWLIGKDPDTGEDWRREKKGTTEDEMVRWHHRLNHMSLSKLRELVMDREARQPAVHVVTKSLRVLSDWTEQMTKTMAFCSVPVDETPCSQCRGSEFNPWLRNYRLQLKIQHTTANIQHSQVNK